MTISNENIEPELSHLKGRFEAFEHFATHILFILTSSSEDNKRIVKKIFSSLPAAGKTSGPFHSGHSEAVDKLRLNLFKKLG